MRFSITTTSYQKDGVREPVKSEISNDKPRTTKNAATHKPQIAKTLTINWAIYQNKSQQEELYIVSSSSLQCDMITPISFFLIFFNLQINQICIMIMFSSCHQSSQPQPLPWQFHGLNWLFHLYMHQTFRDQRHKLFLSAPANCSFRFYIQCQLRYCTL
jgi:hypothetical protein